MNDTIYKLDRFDPSLKGAKYSLESIQGSTDFLFTITISEEKAVGFVLTNRRLNLLRRCKELAKVIKLMEHTQDRALALRQSRENVNN